MLVLYTAGVGAARDLHNLIETTPQDQEELEDLAPLRRHWAQI